MDKKSAVSHVNLIECTSSDFPEELMVEVRKIWKDMEFGNDYYYYSWDGDYDRERYPLLAKYIEEHHLTGRILINWWW